MKIKSSLVLLIFIVVVSFAITFLLMGAISPDKSMLVRGLVLLAVSDLLLLYYISLRKKEKKKFEKELKKRQIMIQKVRNRFIQLDINTPYDIAIYHFSDLEGVSAPNLVSEGICENNTERKIVNWNLSWNYVLSNSMGVGTASNYGTSYNAKSGSSYYSGINNVVTNSTTTARAYIQAVFENGKLIMKEQRGLF